MLVTGFAGMIIKFTEVYICVDEAKKRKSSSGGAMYVLNAIGKRYFKILASFFAAVTVLASFFAGNVIQSKSIYRFSEIGFNIEFIPITLVVIVLLYVILSGKDRMYQNFSAIFVPLMSFIYILSVVIIIFFNISNLPKAVCSIFTSAFGFKEIFGGFSGSVLSKALKLGVMKGLFTHEAGMGSSPIAHSSTKEQDPFCQGCWGIVEVFFDTVVVCMLTALAVLSSPVYLDLVTNDPFQLICSVFEDVFGSVGIKILSLSALLFAFASIVGWSFYGVKALEFFTGDKRFKKIYICIFLTFIPLSFIITESVAWNLTDLFNSLMLLPNMIMVLILGGDAVQPLSKIKKVLEITK
jgi:AGCS family alanine or glycine:cation symporter